MGADMGEVSPKRTSVKVFIKSSLVFHIGKARQVADFAVWKAALAVFLGKSHLALAVGSLQSRDV